MGLSRRSFLASLVAVVAAPLAWSARTVGWDFGAGASWSTRWWVWPTSQPSRLYFSALQDPDVWPEEVSYAVDQICVDHSLRGGCVFRIDAGELLVSPDYLERARGLFPAARVST